MIYDELIRALRETYFWDGCPCGAVPLCKGKDCVIIQGADAIETLYAAYTESFSVIAKAFRNNPKDLVLREYMMKNACCCEVEECE